MFPYLRSVLWLHWSIGLAPNIILLQMTTLMKNILHCLSHHHKQMAAELILNTLKNQSHSRFYLKTDPVKKLKTYIVMKSFCFAWVFTCFTSFGSCTIEIPKYTENERERHHNLHFTCTLNVWSYNSMLIIAMSVQHYLPCSLIFSKLHFVRYQFFFLQLLKFVRVIKGGIGNDIEQDG